MFYFLSIISKIVFIAPLVLCHISCSKIVPSEPNQHNQPGDTLGPVEDTKTLFFPSVDPIIGTKIGDLYYKIESSAIVHSAAFNPSSTLLAAGGYNKKITVYDINKKSQAYLVDSLYSKVLQLLIAPNDILYAFSYDDMSKQFALEKFDLKNKQKTILLEESGKISDSSPRFSSDGRFIVYSKFHVDDKKWQEFVFDSEAKKSVVLGLSLEQYDFIPGTHRLFFTKKDGANKTNNISIFDLGTKIEKNLINVSTTQENKNLEFSPRPQISPDQNRLSFVSMAKFGFDIIYDLMIFDISSKDNFALKADGSQIEAQSFSPKGGFLAAATFNNGETGNIFIYDIATKKRAFQFSFPESDEYANKIIFSPNGKHILLISERTKNMFLYNF
jgi:Tol biopolymer transport system component